MPSRHSRCRLVVASLVLAAAGGLRAAPPPQRSAEIRAFWVDAFHAGIRSPAEARQLVADAKRLNVNTLFVQVRRRGDALYASTLEPPLDDPAYDPKFDALAFVVDEAHASGLQVHAWINAMPVWRDEAPPSDQRHVFNRHGPTSAGDDNWLTRSRGGEQRFPVGYFLDPGHPAARDHLVAVYLDIVRRYPIDGIHFDYIRYPETDDRLPRGANVGYNAVSLARFARATGMAAVPAPGDPQWTWWRRQQVTELVRRISIEARAINPRIKVGAAVIAWGRPPRDAADFENTAPMQRIFQDWRAWLQEGLLDLAVPMNYAREHDPVVREWFNGWIRWEKRNKGARQLAVGVGGYLSRPEGVVAQIARARAAAGRARADGVSIFSYFVPSAGPAQPATAPAQAAVGKREAEVSPPPARLDFLVNGLPPAAGPFAQLASVPSMRWLDEPNRGSLAGTVTRSGAGVEGVRVRITRRRLFGGTKQVVTDANGWFGAMGLKPGRYRVQVDDSGTDANPRFEDVEILPGRVSRVALQGGQP